MSTIELALEAQTLRPRADIKKIYDTALALNKTIIITSDMYLPKAFIQDVLAKNGYANYRHLYLSSDVMKTKSSGNLYRHILDDLKVSPQQILHIGDNQHSDFQVAKKLGIKAHYIPKTIDILFATQNRVKKFYDENNQHIGCSIILGLLANNLVAQESAQNSATSTLDSEKVEIDAKYWHDIGFQYGGVAMYAYAKWLDSEFAKQNIAHALFIARDGYTLQKIYDLIASAPTRSHYTYAPRILHIVCNLDFESRQTMLDEKLSALQTIIEHFRDKDAHLANAPRLDFAKLDEKGENLNDAIDFIRAHKDIYTALAQKERQSYLAYLRTLDLSSAPTQIEQKNIAVIDSVSIFLSSQRFLESMLDSEISNSKIIGFYWFVAPEALRLRAHRSFSTFQNTNEQLFSSWSFMELLLTSPEPPIIGATPNGAIYKNPSKYDNIRSAIYPHISNGAIVFAKQIHDIFPATNTYLDAHLVADWVNAFVKHPTKADKRNFKNVMHAYDTSHSQYIRVISWKQPRSVRMAHKILRFFRKLFKRS